MTRTQHPHNDTARHHLTTPPRGKGMIRYETICVRPPTRPSAHIYTYTHLHDANQNFQAKHVWGCSVSNIAAVMLCWVVVGSVLSPTSQRLYCFESLWGVFCLRHHSSCVALSHCGKCSVLNIMAVVLRWVIVWGCSVSSVTAVMLRWVIVWGCSVSGITAVMLRWVVVGGVLSQTSQRLYCVGALWGVFCLKHCGGYTALGHCVGVYCLKRHSSYIALGRCGKCFVSSIAAVMLRWVIVGGVLSQASRRLYCVGSLCGGVLF